MKLVVWPFNIQILKQGQDIFNSSRDVSLGDFIVSKTLVVNCVSIPEIPLLPLLPYPRISETDQFVPDLSAIHHLLPHLLPPLPLLNLRPPLPLNCPLLEVISAVIPMNVANLLKTPIPRGEPDFWNSLLCVWILLLNLLVLLKDFFLW